jgi:hypothetical protein
MAKTSPPRTRRDRWADWAVVGVLVVALLLGWAVMAFAEGQKSTYADADTGVTVSYPKNWFQRADEKLVFQVLDPDSGLFKTTYQIRAWPIDTSAPLTPTLSSVLNGASLVRAQQGTAYRMFDIVEGKEKDGQPTMEATYVYVVESTDLFSQRMPVVIMGLDIAVASGDKAYVFSLLAEKDAFETAEPDFRRFVRKAEIW